MSNGGTVIKVRDDFTKCNMLVEEVKDYDQDGNLYVTDYKFTNHLIHDAGQDSVSLLSLFLIRFGNKWAKISVWGVGPVCGLVLIWGCRGSVQLKYQRIDQT